MNAEAFDKKSDAGESVKRQLDLSEAIRPNQEKGQCRSSSSNDSVVITYYLEMNSPDQLKEPAHSRELHIVEAKIKQYPVNRFLYQFIGEKWQWRSMSQLPDHAWKEYAENSNLRTWLAMSGGSIAGYYELRKEARGDVEIVHLGLGPKFIGRGFGGYLISHAVRSAWQWNETKRLWLHTCTEDHPAALNSYLSRGFVVYRKERRRL